MEPPSTGEIKTFYQAFWPLRGLLCGLQRSRASQLETTTCTGRKLVGFRPHGVLGGVVYGSAERWFSFATLLRAMVERLRVRSRRVRSRHVNEAVEDGVERRNWVRRRDRAGAAPVLGLLSGKKRLSRRGRGGKRRARCNPWESTMTVSSCGTSPNSGRCGSRYVFSLANLLNIVPVLG